MPYLIKMMLFSFLITAAVEVPLSLLFGARKKGLLIVFIVTVTKIKLELLLACMAASMAKLTLNL